MTEVRFYHLQHKSVESALPDMLEKSLERGWRVIVQSPSQERIDALETTLWTYRDDSFLPHGTARNANSALQPVLLTAEAGNPNGANVRFLIDGAAFPEDAQTYLRLVLLFDGDDDAAVSLARQQWAQAKLSGFDASYWQTDDNGRWNQKL